jgi:hypothetical protein
MPGLKQQSAPEQLGTPASPYTPHEQNVGEVRSHLNSEHVHLPLIG